MRHAKIFCLACMLCIASLSSIAQLPLYPVTPRGNEADTLHGKLIADPYRWLEDDRIDSVQKWVSAQHATTSTYLSKIPYRPRLRQELVKLNNYERYYMVGSTPGATYYFYNNGRHNNSALYRQKTGQNPELILDPDAWSKDGTLKFAGYEFSQDGKWLAFMRSDAGSDWKQIFVMDLTTKTVLKDTLWWTKGQSVQWWRDGFFYSRHPKPDSTQSLLTMLATSSNMYYHKVGTPQSADTLYNSDTSSEKPTDYVHPEGTDLMFRFAYSSMGSSTMHVRQLVPPYTEHEVYTAKSGMRLIDADRDTAYILAYEGLLGVRIVRLTELFGDVDDEVILTFKKRSLKSAWIGGGNLFISSSDYENALGQNHQVDVFTLKGKQINTIALEGEGYSSGFRVSRHDSLMYFNYESYTRPNRICLYNIKDGTTRMWQDMPFNFVPDNYEVKRVLAPGRDGVTIPMTLIYRKGIKFDGTAPTILYGYGSYGTSLNPDFDPLRLAWLDQGGVYAVANLRGGGEFGGYWHWAGAMLSKKTTFHDMISCATWLFKHDITTKDRLAITGVSAGGLMVGAVMTMKPDLCKVAVPRVGVFDMMRFHKFTVGVGNQSEFGDVKVREQFDVLYDYSPYHKVKEGETYPSTMVMTADHDDRAVPLHSFKFVAALQHSYQGPNPTLLRVQARSGHGAVNADVEMDETADVYSFMWNEMGISPNFAPK